MIKIRQKYYEHWSEFCHLNHKPYPKYTKGELFICKFGIYDGKISKVIRIDDYINDGWTYRIKNINSKGNPYYSIICESYMEKDVRGNRENKIKRILNDR